VRGVTRLFGTFEALKGCTFELRGPGVWALIGRNGAGKTTLLRVISGALSATGGEVRVCGELMYPGSTARRHIGVAPELSLYAQELTAVEHLEQMSALRGMGAREAGVEAALEACALQGWAGERVSALSRGTRQRLSVACALLGAPPVLLLDEPSAALDPEQREGLAALLSALSEERLVLLSTHDLELVKRLSALTLRIEGGRLSTPEG
jgi:ABC-2 type transport system ATP-binding protein